MILGRPGPRERKEATIVTLGEESQGKLFFFYPESSLEI